jgi:hypothetical protein
LTGLASSVGALNKAFAVIPNTLKGVTAALGTIGLAAAGIQALTGAATAAGSALGVGLASNMEQVRARFNAFTKDGAETEKILGLVRAEADKTPFAFNEMANAAAMLLPASQTAKGGLMGLVQTSEILAALNPSEGLEGAAFALREALSGDFVSVMERFNIPRELINKLKAEGVPNAEIVGEALKRMGADMDLVSNLAGTTAGRLSTFQDAIDGLRQKVGEPILAAFGEQLDAMSGWLSANQAAVAEFATNLGQFIAQGVRIAGAAIGNLIAFLRPLGPAVMDIGRAALAMVHGDWANAMNGLRSAAATAIAFLDTRFGDVGRVVASLATAALAAVQGDWQGAMTQLGAAAERAGDVLEDVFGGAIAAVQDAMRDFAPTGERLGELFGTIGDAVSDLVGPLGDMAGGLGEAAEAGGGLEAAMDALATVVNAVSAAVEVAVSAGAGFVGWLTESEGGVLALGAALGALSGVLAIQAARWVALTTVMAATRVATLAMAAAQAVLNLALTANPIGIVVVALAALVGALVAAYQTNETFRAVVDAAWAAVRATVLGAVQAAQAAIAGFQAWLAGASGTFQGAAAQIGIGIVTGMVNGITGGIPRVIAAAVGLARSSRTSGRAWGRASSSGWRTPPRTWWTPWRTWPPPPLRPPRPPPPRWGSSTPSSTG